MQEISITTSYPNKIKISQRETPTIFSHISLKLSTPLVAKRYYRKVRAMEIYKIQFPPSPLKEVHKEISVDSLKEALKMDEKEIIKEINELLLSYEIPLEYRDEIISKIKEQIKSEINKQNLPHAEWLEEALFKLYVRLANKLLCI